MTQQLDKYKIIKKLGAGATAEVYHAVDTGLDRHVALKVLKPSLVSDSSSFARFVHEAKAAAQLFHDHIATVLDMGDAEGRYFIAMRYIEGESLDKILKQEGPLSWEETLRLAEQIGEALDYAHGEGFLHRDVKPSNIIRDEKGNFWLTDFGLTRAMMSTGLTSHTGAVLGTPSYIAPEVWQGEDAVPATDQYALACVVYESLTGEVLFTGDTPPAVMTGHMLKGPEFPANWPEGTSPTLQATLSRALSTKPSERYENASAFSATLKGSEQTSAVSDQPLAESPTLKAPWWQNWRVWAGFVGVVVLGVIFWPDASKETAEPIIETVTEVPIAEESATEKHLSEEPDLGTEENPIVWAVVPSGETERVVSGFENVADLIYDETGLVIDAMVATEYAGVIEAMCSDPAKAQIGSLATFAYVLANEKGCAEAALVSVRYGSAVYNGQIFVRADSGIESLEDLAGKTFCRPDPLSTSGWIIPSITLKAAGVDPAKDLAEVVTAGSHDAAIAGVYNGDCDAGASYVDARGTVEEDYPDVMNVIKILEISADIPNDGLQFVPGFDEELKTQIVDALLAITETEEGQAALDTTYSWTELEKQGDSFYDSFRQVLDAAGVSAEDLQ